MTSVIISTLYLLIVGIISISLSLTSLITKEIKIIPLINFATMMFVCIVSLFLGADLIEPLIFILIHLIVYLFNIFVRHKKEV